MHVRRLVVLSLALLAGAVAAPGAAATTPTTRAQEGRAFGAAVHTTVQESNAQLRAKRAEIDARRLAIGSGCYDTLLALGEARLSARTASAALAGYLLYTLGDGLQTIVIGPTRLLARIGPRTRLHTRELRRARAALAAVDGRQRATTFPSIDDFCLPLRAWSASRFTPGTVPGAFAQAADAFARVTATEAEDAALGVGAAVLQSHGGLGRADAAAFADTSLETETQRLFTDPVVGVLFLLSGPYAA